MRCPAYCHCKGTRRVKCFSIVYWMYCGFLSGDDRTMVEKKERERMDALLQRISLLKVD